MYKRILVPTDGSDTATAGLREAIKLAKDQNAHVRLDRSRHSPRTLRKLRMVSRAVRSEP
jgi:nucleotide-binding universal stress UspA family protein